jgi:hypothetical protein
MKAIKGFLNLFIVSCTITLIVFPVAAFIHEGTHYLMYTIEGIEVTSFHVLDKDSFDNGYCGYITPLKTSKYGSLFQEAVAYSVECLFMASTLLYCLVKPFKSFTISQLDTIGMRKKATSTQ